jgi:hypothetical protein
VVPHCPVEACVWGLGAEGGAPHIAEQQVQPAGEAQGFLGLEMFGFEEVMVQVWPGVCVGVGAEGPRSVGQQAQPAGKVSWLRL